MLFTPFLSFSQEPGKLLTSTKFKNGELIPEAKTASEWEQLSMNNQPVFMKKMVQGIEYYFYNWYAVSDIRKLTNENFIIPDQYHFQIINAYSRFQITPIGIISEQGAFTKVSDQQYYWTTSEYNEKGKRESAVSFSISTVNNDEIELKQAYKQEGFLVLVVEKEKMSIAIKEAAKLMLDAKKSTSTIVNNTTKIETNSTTVNSTTTKDYKTVKIGSQIWMTENLNVDRFRNGDLIPEAKTANEWVLAGKNEQPAWCYYYNDSMNGENNGKLYNWYAVNDSRGLAPIGWNIPSDEAWDVLSKSLGGNISSGKKLKSTYWWSSKGNGNNLSSFSAFPGGFRTNYNGNFYFLRYYGYWWTSSESNTEKAYFVSLEYKNNRFHKNNLLNKSERNKSVGFSVRCIQD